MKIDWNGGTVSDFLGYLAREVGAVALAASPDIGHRRLAVLNRKNTLSQVLEDTAAVLQCTWRPAAAGGYVLDGAAYSASQALVTSAEPQLLRLRVRHWLAACALPDAAQGPYFEKHRLELGCVAAETGFEGPPSPFPAAVPFSCIGADAQGRVLSGKLVVEPFRNLTSGQQLRLTSFLVRYLNPALQRAHVPSVFSGPQQLANALLVARLDTPTGRQDCTTAVEVTITGMGIPGHPSHTYSFGGVDSQQVHAFPQLLSAMPRSALSPGEWSGRLASLPAQKFVFDASGTQHIARLPDLLFALCRQCNLDVVAVDNPRFESLPVDLVQGFPLGDSLRRLVAAASLEPTAGNAPLVLRSAAWWMDNVEELPARAERSIASRSGSRWTIADAMAIAAQLNDAQIRNAVKRFPEVGALAVGAEGLRCVNAMGEQGRTQLENAGFPIGGLSLQMRDFVVRTVLTQLAGGDLAEGTLTPDALRTASTVRLVIRDNGVHGRAYCLKVTAPGAPHPYEVPLLVT